MKKLLQTFLFVVVFLPQLSLAQAGLWNLPIQLNDSNTQLKFEVDSTWHTIHGVAKNLSGKLWLKDPTDHSSVQGEAVMLTRNLDTDNRSRDAKMRDVMAEKDHKEIVFHLKKVEKICAPQEVIPNTPCSLSMRGDLTIRGNTKEVLVEGKLSATPTGYLVEAGTTLDWSEYGVKDPSIFIARVDKKVSISVRVSLENPK